MRTIPLKLLVVAAVTSGGAAAVAQPGPRTYIPGVHGGPHDSYYSAWASAVVPEKNPTELLYEVCNRGRAGLVYAWDTPGFATGLLHPLSPDSCNDFALPALKGIVEDGTHIQYSNTNKQPAIALVPKRDTWQHLGDGAKAVLFRRSASLPFPKSTYPDRQILVEVYVQDKGNQTVYEVRWYQKIGSLALRLAPISEAARQQIADDLRSASQSSGAKLRLVPAEELSDSLKEDLASLPGDVRTGYYIVIEPTSATDKVQVSFGLKLGKTGMDYQPVIVRDTQGRLMWMFKYVAARQG